MVKIIHYYESRSPSAVAANAAAQAAPAGYTGNPAQRYGVAGIKLLLIYCRGFEFRCRSWILFFNLNSEIQQ